MAGVTKIGQHEVTEIKRDAAQVGCTRVTRAEVEQLLKQMDSAPVPGFIENWESNSEYVKFTLRDEDTGWSSGSVRAADGYGNTPFSLRSVSFCLRHERAQKLFEFLGGALGHHSYNGNGYNTKFTQV